MIWPFAKRQRSKPQRYREGVFCGVCPQCHTNLTMVSGIGPACLVRECPVGDDSALWPVNAKGIRHALDCRSLHPFRRISCSCGALP